MGPYYLWISALLWCGFFVFLRANVFLTAVVGAIFGELVTILFFTALFFTLASTMPQNDHLSVLEKMKRGVFPDRITVYEGLLRVGVQCDTLLKKSSDDFDTGVKRTIKEMKK